MSALKTRTEHSSDASRDTLDVLQNVGFPEAKDQPTCGAKGPIVPLVPRDVRADLRNPVGGVVPLLQLPQPALDVPPMPEIAIAEDDDTLAREDNVWPSR